MGRDRTEQATPDLFLTASPGEPSPPAKQVSSAQERRHVLPKDLPNAVKHLDDRELDLLITASLEEAKRRGRLLPRVQANRPDESAGKRSSRMDKSSYRRQLQMATVSLTRGQVNAVRAAAKAGIKPSVIARQFGISQSDVLKRDADSYGLLLFQAALMLDKNVPERAVVDGRALEHLREVARTRPRQLADMC